MKKNALFIFLFICLFLFSFDSVEARYDEGLGNHSYGIMCVYTGERKCTVTGASTAGNVENGEINPFSFALKVYCEDSSCSRLATDSVGYIKNINGAIDTINHKTFIKVDDLVNESRSKFGFSVGKGVSKCPSAISFSMDDNLGTLANRCKNFGNLSLKKGGIPLESSQTFSESESSSIDVSEFADNSVSTKRRKSYNNGESSEEEESQDFIQNILNFFVLKKDDDYNGVIENGDVSCVSLLGDDNVKLISTGFIVISIVGIILLVVLVSTDFIKAVAASDDDENKKAFKNFRTRLISIVILLLLPFIVNFVLNFIDDHLYLETVNVKGEKTGESSIKLGNVNDCGLLSDE